MRRAARTTAMVLAGGRGEGIEHDEGRALGGSSALVPAGTIIAGMIGVAIISGTGNG